jgi:hypothetical protein
MEPLEASQGHNNCATSFREPLPTLVSFSSNITNNTDRNKLKIKMNTTAEKTAIEKLMALYGEAVNATYARTHSKGSTVIRTTGATVPVDNKEIFGLHKGNGGWKISHYIFNKYKIK